MPPHCDSLDGPVVLAAREALESHDVSRVLPYVHAEGEAEVSRAFDEVLPVHDEGGRAAELSDRLFFETVVRVHRAGEHAPYTGLKPAGLDVGPAIPLAEKALASGDEDEIADFLSGVVRDSLRDRMMQVRALKKARDGSVEAERRYVEAMLGFQVFSHRIYRDAISTQSH